jgi:hypothetical protein
MMLALDGAPRVEPVASAAEQPRARWGGDLGGVFAWLDGDRVKHFIRPSANLGISDRSVPAGYARRASGNRR